MGFFFEWLYNSDSESLSPAEKIVAFVQTFSKAEQLTKWQFLVFTQGHFEGHSVKFLVMEKVNIAVIIHIVRNSI